MNHIYIASVTGSRGCHDDSDTHRAIEAAECALANVNARAAYGAFIARCGDEKHDAALADAWERAQSAADIAFTEGWAKPGGVLVELTA